MNTDRTSIGPLHKLSFHSLVKFYTISVVISLSGWTLNGECLSIHKSPVNPKDPPAYWDVYIYIYIYIYTSQ